MRNSLLFLLALSAFVAAAFRSPLPASAADPDPTKATLVIYRGGQFMGAALNYNIYVNGQKICKLSNERYIEYAVAPGKVVVTAERGGVEVFKKETGLDLDTEAGKRYYVRGDLKTSFTRSRLELSEVTESTAKRDMAKLSVDNCQQQPAVAPAAK